MFHSSTDVALTRDWFASLSRLRRRTRRARHGYWFPLVAFGLLILGALPLYRTDLPPLPDGAYAVSYGSVFQTVTPIDAFGLGQPFMGSAASWYWLIGLPSAFIATGVFYRWRHGRLGFATPAWPFVTTGLVLLLFLLATDDYFRSQLGLPEWLTLRTWNADLYARGMIPLLLIAVAVCVLAVTERSLALTAVALVYGYFAWKANTYDFVNTAGRAGLDVPFRLSLLPNLAVPGLLLITPGIAAGIVAYRQRVASH